MIKSSHDQVLQTIHWYVNNKVPFLYVEQNETITVKSKMGSYTTLNHSYTVDELNFIKKVKRTVIKDHLYEPYSRRYRTQTSLNRIKYYLHSQKLKPSFIAPYSFNIDLDSAYWETAFKYGLLPVDIYKEGLVVRKQVRLTAIGSWAKKTRIYEFDGKVQKLLSIQRNEKIAMLWPLICDHVGRLISHTAQECKNDFLFFWVDGIYVREGVQKKVQKLFKKAGYNSDIALCEKIEVTPRHIWVTCTEKAKIKTIDGEDILIDTWPFPYRSKDVQEEMKGYNTDL